MLNISINEVLGLIALGEKVSVPAGRDETN